MFDDFSSISIDEKDTFERYKALLFKSISSENNISDLCFSNLFSWSAVIETHTQLIDDYYCVVVKLCDRYHIYAPFGDAKPERYEKVIDRLYEKRNQDAPLTFTMVSEGLLGTFRKLKKYKFNIVHDMNYSDYIYNNTDFIYMLNKPSARYKYNRFLRNHNPSIQAIDSRNKHICPEMMEHYWCRVNDCSRCHFGCELKALKKNDT